MEGEALCVGDKVCLYSEDVHGYIHSFQSRYTTFPFLFACVCVSVCACVRACVCVIVRMYSNDVNLPHRRHDRQRLAFNLWGTSEREPMMVLI